MKFIIDALKKRKINPKVIRYLEYGFDLLYWILLVYVAISSYHYFYDFCGLKIVELQQNCVIQCGNYTPIEYNWTNIVG